jgi:transcriptional regulator with XRE-family HTH domain
MIMANNLELFLNTPGLKQKLFAEAIGIKESQLSRIKTGQANPTARTARKIVRGTYGAVSFEDLFLPEKEGVL